MSRAVTTYVNGRIFDGLHLRDGVCARFEDGVFIGLVLGNEASAAGDIVDLQGDILSSGYVDLQVNGGGGVMFNDDPSVSTLRTMASAHRGLGVTTFLPTLITDDADTTTHAIAAAAEAIRVGLPGIAGLHLEGPHLSVARKGAHDPDLIRPMNKSDLDQLLKAASLLPVLKVTIAPEAVTAAQVETLSKAGVIVSLGHTDAGFDTCLRYFAAGATCATHLFNAMSQLGSREPGLVGAALATETVSAGVIADAVHVHPMSLKTAWAAKAGPGRIYLVSDAMAVAGTTKEKFCLGGRSVTRRNGVLTLADGTLAGADLDLTRAINVLHIQAGVGIADALCAATSAPAEIAGLPNVALRPGETKLTDLNRISPTLSDLVPLG
ncbi:MAG: N-acetylglucosamine-6-phosphate deacetylase [Pseudomonadota bacterium]